VQNNGPFLQALKSTRILKPPKHAIATFGTTTLRYILLSDVPGEPASCRLRQGEVTAQRPQIMTPDFWKKRFEGFGEEAEAFGEQMEKVFGDALKGLEYSFRNDLKTTSLEHASLSDVAERTQKVIEAEDAPRTALLVGPDAHWSFSVMKLIVDISMRSFPANVRELDDRGFFNPEKKRDERTRFEIEKLFEQARTNRTQIPKLAERLKQTDLFADYEDRFFALVGS